MLDVTKMREMAEKMYGGQEIQRGLAIQAVDINTGDVVIFDENTP